MAFDLQDIDGSGALPSGDLETVLDTLFETFDREADLAAVPRIKQAPEGGGPTEGSNGATSQAVPLLAPPLLAPGGMARRPSQMECFEMTDVADPSGKGAMDFVAFLRAVVWFVRKISPPPSDAQAASAMEPTSEPLAKARSTAVVGKNGEDSFVSEEISFASEGLGRGSDDDF